ncbi:MAG: hypothetical protein ACRD96_06620, partial [Bryobacteraceae bacterium]
MRFDLVAARFDFRAIDPLLFPAGQSGNVIRGAFGAILRGLVPEPEYARVFAPRASSGPSGFADAARPFVFRAAHLDGRRIAPQE